MKYLLLTATIFAIHGCATATDTKLESSGIMNAKNCKYIERDLTANWNSRSYWCLPASEQTNSKVQLIRSVSE